MEADFWIDKWKKNEINFHLGQANPLLVKHFGELSLTKGSRVFLPLCGKTLDAVWMLQNGYRIVGAELVEMAIIQFFEELKISPQISQAGKLKLYSAPNLDFFVGDVFDLHSEALGEVDAIYDRAALVALPEETRKHYTSHLFRISNNAPQLVIVFDYDQRIMQGPPFSISDLEVQNHYKNAYKVKLIESTEVAGGLKGHSAKEKVWLLTKVS